MQHGLHAPPMSVRPTCPHYPSRLAHSGPATNIQGSKGHVIGRASSISVHLTSTHLYSPLVNVLHRGHLWSAQPGGEGWSGSWAKSHDEGRKEVGASERHVEATEGYVEPWVVKGHVGAMENNVHLSSYDEGLAPHMAAPAWHLHDLGPCRLTGLGRCPQRRTAEPSEQGCHLADSSSGS